MKSKNTSKCIVNMLNTKKGEHCLFREFGLNVTDSVGQLKKGDIRSAVVTWFPSVSSLEVTRIGGDSSNGFVYKVNVEEA